MRISSLRLISTASWRISIMSILDCFSGLIFVANLEDLAFPVALISKWSLPQNEVLEGAMFERILKRENMTVRLKCGPVFVLMMSLHKWQSTN